MLKIKKIKIENFRGIKSPVIIDFYKGGSATSALVYGRNGTGKSSIVDGWEWLINSKIDFLSKEGVSERDYPHKLSNGDNSYVEVEFVHPDINSVKATFNKNRIKLPTHSGEYDSFKAQTIYPNYLRYSDLQEFVYKSKGDKYKYIAKFFGLEQFIKNQSDIQSSLTRLTNQLTNIESQLQVENETITKITGSEVVDESTVVSFINSIAVNYKIDEILEFKDSYKVKQAMSEIIKANPIAAELAAWKAFQTRLNQFYSFAEVVQNCIDLEIVFNELKKDEKNITNLILIELYSKASETLSKLDDKTKCPVCDKIFEGDLTEHISNKHKVLETLNKQKKEYISKRDAILHKLEQKSRKIAIIQAESNDKVLIALQPFFSDIEFIENELPHITTELKKPFKDLDSLKLSTNEDILKIDAISKRETEYKQFVIDKIKELSEDKNSKDLAVNFDSVIQVITAYTNFLKNKKKVGYLSTITTKLNQIFVNLTSFIQKQIQNTFTAIQTDLNYCYNFLESSNRFLKNPEIKLVTGRDKAVELEIEFADEKVSPAYKFMSESQVNSFGLSVFLSAVKHFNNDFKFIVLDDVVNSFDAFKRPKVSQLLANRFSDFQVLMLTHDQIFFDTVQRDFPQWNRYKFAGWDYTTGPRCSFTTNYIEEIQKLIEDDEPISAGQKLGRYLEMVFGILNQNLKTPIQYKLENVYTLSEFYNPLVKRFKDKLKLPNKKHIISNLFSEFEQGTIFRNYCAHYKNEATQFTSEEIDGVFKKWLEIEEQIYCEICKSYCHLENSGGTEYVRCNCGTLDLKVETKFMDN